MYRRKFVSILVVGLSGCVGFGGSPEYTPLRVRNSSNDAVELEISAEGSMTGFMESLSLSPGSEQLYEDAIQKSDSDYEFTLSVTVSSNGQTFSENLTQSLPDEFLVDIASQTEVTIQKVESD